MSEQQSKNSDSRTSPSVTEPMARPSGAVLPLLLADSRRAAVTSLGAMLAFVIVDYAATLVAAPGDVAFATALRLLCLEITLGFLALAIAIPTLVGAAAAARIAALFADPGRARQWPGLFGPSVRRGEPQALAAWLWGLGIAIGVFIGASTVATLRVSAMFKEPQLTAFVLALVQVVAIALCAAIAYAVSRGILRLARLLQKSLGRMSPFGAAPPALAVLALLVLGGLLLATRLMPQMGPLIPWRHILAVLAFGVGGYATTQLYGRRDRLLPVAPGKKLVAVAVALFAISALVPVTLFKLGADPDTKGIAVSSSPPMATLIAAVRRANDFDGDGFGSLLGEQDCGPFDAEVHPLARDIPDNDIDENCDGRDFRLGTLPTYKTGERMPVPEAYQSDWNILLLTVDTVRYDHTSFGGYIEKTGRDTTPQLAKFVKRSVSFAFANAPSAGTMASVPAILTSKFFHSGIALDEDVPRGTPPKLKPENTLISEVLKKRGYTTGAILSHYYFNDWGMEQGFDTYDNSIGKKNQPYAVTSDRLTDRAIDWIGRRSDKKWFLWVHYLDPHGRYVEHPGERSFGTTEEDIYDGELYFTDKHIGRLLDHIAHSAYGQKTIIVLTSDHGDGFKEHGYINHGQDLHREILHVPLIVYIPNIEPQIVEGAVSPIDIFPTIADLAGAEDAVRELNIEGESLVPQIFYGKDADHRVVFAETNYQNHLRAAITSEYKLIRDLQTNVYRLYDLKEDPWEQRNARTSDKAGFEKMKRYLDEWLERVYYARDPETNQAMAKLEDHLVRKLPDEAQDVDGISFDDGRIQVVAIETDQKTYKRGEEIKLALYFRATERPSGDFKLQVEAWPADDPGSGPKAASQLRFTGKGILSTSRWRDGEHVRDRFRIRLPTSWFGTEKREIAIGLRMTGDKGKALPPTGPTRPSDENLARIGGVSLEPR